MTDAQRARAMPMPTPTPTLSSALDAAAAFVAECRAAEAAYAAALSSTAQRYMFLLTDASAFGQLPLAVRRAAEAHASLERALSTQVQSTLHASSSSSSSGSSFAAEHQPAEVLQRASRAFHLAAEQAVRQHLAAYDNASTLLQNLYQSSASHHSPELSAVTTPDSASPFGPGQPTNVTTAIGHHPDWTRFQSQPQQFQQSPPVSASATAAASGSNSIMFAPTSSSNQDGHPTLGPLSPPVTRSFTHSAPVTPTSPLASGTTAPLAVHHDRAEQAEQQTEETEVLAVSPANQPPPSYNEPARPFDSSDLKTRLSPSPEYEPVLESDTATVGYRPHHRAGTQSALSLSGSIFKYRHHGASKSVAHLDGSGTTAPTESSSATPQGHGLRPSASSTSLRDAAAAGGEYRNPLKSAFSKFGKTRPTPRRGRSIGPSSTLNDESASQVPTLPMTVTASAPGVSAGSGTTEPTPPSLPARVPLKRSTTLGSLMSRRRKKNEPVPPLFGGGSADKTSSGPIVPPTPPQLNDQRTVVERGEAGWDGVVYDDTLRQIYRTQGTGSIEVHNLAYKAHATGKSPARSPVGTSPRTITGRHADLSLDESVPNLGEDTEDPLPAPRLPFSNGAAPTPARTRTPPPPPQPVFTEEVRLERKPSKAAAVLRWRSQNKGSRTDKSVARNAATTTSAHPASEPSTPANHQASSLFASDDDHTQLLNNDALPSLVTEPPSDQMDPQSSVVHSRSSSTVAPIPALNTTSLVSTSTALGSVTIQPSVTETVNALLAGAEVRRLLVTGEVRISLGPVSSWDALGQDHPDDAQAQYVPLQLTGIEYVERCTPHPDFLRETNPVNGVRTYLLDVHAVRQAAIQVAHNAPNHHQPKMSLPLFKYQVNLPGSWRTSIPLDVGVQWRAEEGKASMLVSYKFNPQCTFAFGGNLESIRVAAPLNVPVKSARSKPAGQWDEAAQVISWSLPAVPLSTYDPHDDRILARFDTQGWAQPQPLAIQWTLPDRTLSPLNLVAPTSSGMVWAPAQRTTVAGKYLAVAPSS